jgi:hypothetical protein
MPWSAGQRAAGHIGDRRASAKPAKTAKVAQKRTSTTPSSKGNRKP